jgi:hypothetical protein
VTSTQQALVEGSWDMTQLPEAAVHDPTWVPPVAAVKARAL